MGGGDWACWVFVATMAGLLGLAWFTIGAGFLLWWLQVDIEVRLTRGGVVNEPDND